MKLKNQVSKIFIFPSYCLHHLVSNVISHLFSKSIYLITKLVYDVNVRWESNRRVHAISMRAECRPKYGTQIFRLALARSTPMQIATDASRSCQPFVVFAIKFPARRRPLQRTRGETGRCTTDTQTSLLNVPNIKRIQRVYTDYLRTDEIKRKTWRLRMIIFFNVLRWILYFDRKSLRRLLLKRIRLLISGIWCKFIYLMIYKIIRFMRLMRIFNIPYTLRDI